MDQVKKAVTAAMGELALVRDHMQNAQYFCPPNTPEHFKLLVLRQQVSNLEDNIAEMIGEIAFTTSPEDSRKLQGQLSPR